ncbi:jg10910 [Pararge aegeria aegeria]|uniref:Jg10910 protein n=1 Tax=Pararge aegeria aegeria TaxID=348720 RepID=A0A8S4SHG7_9NEOP|nr:jg10910 [Pararge aegeria aegeria]
MRQPLRWSYKGIVPEIVYVHSTEILKRKSCRPAKQPAAVAPTRREPSAQLPMSLPCLTKLRLQSLRKLLT